MNIPISESITFLISIAALCVSIIVIILTKRNLKKQLRLSKLEEMLESVHYLNGYYHSLFNAFMGIKNTLNSLQESDNINDEIKDSIKYRAGLIDVIDKESITQRISRLNVLSNAYLNNASNLKIRIHILSQLFYDMYMFICLQGEPKLIIED